MIFDIEWTIFCDRLVSQRFPHYFTQHTIFGYSQEKFSILIIKDMISHLFYVNFVS